MVLALQKLISLTIKSSVDNLKLLKFRRTTVQLCDRKKLANGLGFTKIDFSYHQISGQFESFVLVPNFQFKISSYNLTIVRQKETSKWSCLYKKLISLTIKSSVDNLNPSCWYPISDSSCEFHILIPGMSSVRPSAFKRRHVLLLQYKGLLLAFVKARAFAFLLWFLSAACAL